MKYTSETTVNIPLHEFVTKLDNPENMKHWQKGLIDFEFTHGIPGEVGAKMKIRYKMGNRDLELIETVTHSEFPNAFHAIYDTKGMHNVQENFFKELPNGQTKWTSKNEFIATNFMFRMMTLLMPGAFKKQSKQYMLDFKNFAEKGTTVALS